MTTSSTPVGLLVAQAARIASKLKAAERGENTDPGAVAARKKQGIKFAIAMDDKTIVIEMDWSLICDTTEQALTELLVREMQGKRNDA
jgi:hypothetical protein